MASTDARPVPIKNTAFRAYFTILDADGDPVTAAAALDSEVSLDGAAFADCTNEATEISQGVYYLDLTSGEMNADAVCVIVKTTTSGAKAPVMVFYPQESGDIKVDVQSFGGSAGTFASGRPEVNTTHAAGTAWGSGAITAGSVAAAALNGKGDWNIGKTGYALSAAGVQAIWDALSTALTTVGSIGKRIVDNLDAAISTRLATSGYTAPLDAAGVRTAVGLASANLDTQLTAIDDYIDTEVAAILAAVDTEVAAIKAKTDNLPSGIAKNTALAGFTFLMVDSTDHVTPKTTLTVTAQRSLDGGAFAACANAVAELSNGLYKIDLAAADLNANNVVLRFTAAGADATIIAIKTSA